MNTGNNKAQVNKVFKAFSERPKTMLMVSVETGVRRANICRYVAKWRKENTIQEYKKGLCVVSLNRASFFTTNPELFKTSKR